jgi:hypothetical protein
LGNNRNISGNNIGIGIGMGIIGRGNNRKI